MTKINGGIVNKSIIDLINTKLKELHSQSNQIADDTIERTTINGKVYLKSEEEKVTKLHDIISILEFDGTEFEENSLLCFGQQGSDPNDITKIYMEPSKQEVLFDLVNDSEVKAAGIKFPDVFGEYGEIPNTNGLKRPRPKGLFEDIENYESYLENYYKDTEHKKELDSNGFRKPYPHELYIWSKGSAQPSTDSSYRAQSYLDYIADKQNKQQTGATINTSSHSSETITSKAPSPQQQNIEPNQTEQERNERAEKRKQIRASIREGFKIRVKEIKNFWKSKLENVKADFETLKGGTKEEKWKVAKKLLVTGALVVAGGIIASQVAGPLLSVLGTGTMYSMTTMMSGALTGIIPTSSGMITLTIADRIVYGLISAAVPASVLYGVIRLAKLSKQKGETVIIEPTPESTTTTGEDSGSNDSENTGGNNTQNNNNGNNSSNPPLDTEPVIEGTTPEEKLSFVENKLVELANEINEKIDSIKLLNESPEKDLDPIQDKIQEYTQKLNQLNTLRRKYIKARNTIIDEANIHINAGYSMGGATI